MEIKSLGPRSFHVTLGPTESKFLNELAFSNDRPTCKILTDLIFATLIEHHAQMRIDEMIKDHDVYWDH